MDCLFCKIVNGEIPTKKIYEDDLVIAFLDINPNGEGHTLVVPKKHYTDYKELPEELLIHIYKVADKISDKLEKKLNKHSVSFIFNYLDAQQIKHFHLHIVPAFGKPMNHTQDEVYSLMKEN